MHILITGATVNRNNDQYEVLYKNKIVLQHRSQEVCMVTALTKNKLETLFNSSNNLNAA